MDIVGVAIKKSRIGVAPTGWGLVMEANLAKLGNIR